MRPKTFKEACNQRGSELLEPFEGDLFTFLDLNSEEFNFKMYLEHEKMLLKPALEKKGFSNVMFWSEEEGSFGPLTRGLKAEKGGFQYNFYYG